MTLRVTLQIVPHGRERDAYVIGYMDTSNQGRGDSGLYEYSAYQSSDGETKLIEAADGSLVHNRKDGAWTLVRKALELKGFSK